MVVGTSVGAWVGSFVSSFAKKDGREMADFIVDGWLSLNPEDILTPFSDDLFHLGKYNIYHRQEMIKDMLTDLIPDGKFKRKYSIGVTEMKLNLEYRAINVNELSETDGLEAASILISASGALPALF